MKKVITAMAILISSTLAVAGGFGDTEVEQAKAQKQLQERQSYVGLKVYYQTAGCTSAIEVREAPSTAYDVQKYKSAKPVSAIVKEYVPFSVGGKRRSDIQDMGEYYVLEFEDGAIGYVAGHLMPWVHKDMKLSRYTSDCMTTYDPAEKAAYFAAEDAKKEKESAERKAAFEREMAGYEKQAKAQAAYRAALQKKPGVTVGMTAQEVINKTNWGRPAKVNRTTTASGVDEQWVYGGGNYLYFRNGVLRSIQN